MVLIGLGSNLGASAAIVRAAMERLSAHAAGPLLRSSLWRTSPVDCPPGAGGFINAVVAFAARPALRPETLLADLKAIEREYGPRESVRNAPRALDLDLLLFNDELRDSAAFSLPHPRAVQRRFVLAPAAEVAPELIWPGTGRSIRALLDALVTDEQVIRLESDALA
jgi:2-amino-4-hydroxy-6-hydroxymethyldihydropteridine diphosphokinase